MRNDYTGKTEAPIPSLKIYLVLKQDTILSSRLKTHYDETGVFNIFSDDGGHEENETKNVF